MFVRFCTGRIWAGHNILRFDCARIREAFAEIGQPAPEPKGTIDSLAVLTQRFGRRAGDMKVYNSLCWKNSKESFSITISANLQKTILIFAELISYETFF